MQTRRAINLFSVLAVIACGFIAMGSVRAAETLYFPDSGEHWETLEPTSVGWDSEKLGAALDVAGARKSSGVVILYKGRILAERYWEEADDSQSYRNLVSGRDARGRAIEDVASAQKSIVAVLTGMAQERGFLQIDDPVANYVGTGWTKASTSQEAAITIRHLLSMNSGLNTDFSFAAAPASVWLYNTPVYHELMRVLIAATGMDRESLTREWVTEPLGMNDSAWTARPWASSDIAVGFSTTARELARFGLMIQAGGRWAGEAVIQDNEFLEAMLRPSQAINPAYGFLWWLNGQDFSLGTGPQAGRRDGAMVPAAPSDMVAMQGALDRKLYLVPSLDLVVARLGSTGSANGTSFNDAFWEALMEAAPKP